VAASPPPRWSDPNASIPTPAARALPAGVRRVRKGARGVRSGVRLKAALKGGLRRKLGIDKQLVAVEHTRDISKSMVHNAATPDIKVDPETYEVTADDELLTCAPADVLPMAQRYFLF
jgi:urease subunit alpha